MMTQGVMCMPMGFLITGLNAMAGLQRLNY